MNYGYKLVKFLLETHIVLDFEAHFLIKVFLIKKHVFRDLIVMIKIYVAKCLNLAFYVKLNYFVLIFFLFQ